MMKLNKNRLPVVFMLGKMYRCDRHRTITFAPVLSMAFLSVLSVCMCALEFVYLYLYVPPVKAHEEQLPSGS